MDDQLREIARLLRGYLPQLLGDAAPEFDREVRELLARGSGGEEVDEPLAELLSRSVGVTDWVGQVLGDDEMRPPELQPVPELGFKPLPGRSSPVDAQRYVCPVDGNFAWYRPFVGVPIRGCPDHAVTLVLG